MPEQLRFIVAEPDTPAGDIRDWKAATASRCNWGWLQSALGGKITPSDIDFVVERNGFFLVGEIKQRRKDIRQGQDIMLRRLAALPGMAVFYLIGKIDHLHQIHPHEMLTLRPGVDDWQAVTRDGFYEYCRLWFEAVSKQ